MTLAKGHLSDICQHFLNEFSSETTGPVSLNFIYSHQAKEERKSIFLVPCHMTKLPTMPIYGKNLEKAYSSEPSGRLP